MMQRSLFLACALAAAAVAGCTPAAPSYDLIIRNGTVYDGLGGEPFVADVAIFGDRIAAILRRCSGPANRRAVANPVPARR